MFFENKSNELNEVEVKYIKGEKSGTICNGNYKPGDVDSIFNCVDHIARETARFKENIENVNAITGCQFEGFDSIHAIFRRADHSVIDEVILNDIEEVKQTSNFLSKFMVV